jgi:hypothetical protein|tara:strand:+ start:80 stop:268 length:189 start_codon:yes stop_codon:yes gene_type:complete
MELLNLLLAVLIIFIGAQCCDLSRFIYLSKRISARQHVLDVCGGVAVSVFGFYKLITCMVYL